MVPHRLPRTSRLAVRLFTLLLLPAPAAAQRLPTLVTPEHYDLAFTVDLQHDRFEGADSIRAHVAEPTRRIVLHALDIEFQSVTIGQQSATVALNPQAETATFTVPQTIPKGPVEIRIRYTGILNDKLRGFYVSKGQNRKYAVTQFESTDARRAFPCFDEPAFKATFALKLTIDRGDTAISNGRVVSDVAGPSSTQHTLTFSTTAKMSTYLVAMAVGAFECLEGGADGVPIRICATPDKKALGGIALDAAEHILTFYDGYYAIKYPFGKLDVVAVPDFAAGAMENTAAIFYRETDLLADSARASVPVRKNIASILAHEMAHQWFGDLVTMKWWDDLWLNEGFATWMANRPLAAWKPEWNIAVDEGLETQAALNLDSLTSTRPIHDEVETPAEIEAAFDMIAYEKGAAVLRMIEGYLGADAFKKGVNAYVQRFASSNATSRDFWTTLAASSARPVDRIMPTFVNQPGFPLFDVTQSCTAGRAAITLTQQRFFQDPTLLKAGSTQRWETPVCIKTDTQATPTCEVVGESRRTISLQATGCPSWVFVNAGAQGYYRSAYPPAMLAAIAPRVEATLTAPERLSLAGDEWALVAAGRHTVAEYLTLAAGFGSERTSGVLGLVTGRLGMIHDDLTTDVSRPRFETFIRSLLRPSFDEAGFNPAPGDSDDRRTLRALLVGVLGTLANDPDVVAPSRTALDQALAGAVALDPTLASAIVDVAATHGDEKLYDALLAAARRATAPDEHYRYLDALPKFRDAALIDRGLEYARSPELRSQDTPSYLSRFIANPAARERAWSFIKAHWDELAPKITISGGDTNLVGSLAAFCDAGARDDIKAFFTAHKVPAAARTHDQTIERINSCIALRERESARVAEWLEKHSP